MARSALVVAMIALAPGLPDACGRALGKSNEPNAPLPAPTPAPVASATAPPVWAPPETAAPPPTAPAPPPSPELAKARVLAQAGETKKVRALLEKKVKSGKSSKEEAALLLEACTALRDKACIDMVKSKHPELDGP